MISGEYRAGALRLSLAQACGSADRFGVAAVSANLWYAFARETGATVARPALVNLEFTPAAPVFTATAGAPPADLGQTDHIGALLAPVFVFELTP